MWTLEESEEESGEEEEAFSRNVKGKKTKKPPSKRNEGSGSGETVPLTKEEIQTMINQQVRNAAAGASRRPYKRQGRPYPALYDQVPYPNGYSMPKFRMFSGEGKDDNPNQHLSHFKACCGNTGGDNIFLLRQFAQSLTGAAFDWYCSLKDDSIKTWEDMEEAFIEKFAIITEQVSIYMFSVQKSNINLHGYCNN